MIFAHAMVSGGRVTMTAADDLNVCMALRRLPEDEYDMTDD